MKRRGTAPGGRARARPRGRHRGARPASRRRPACSSSSSIVVVVLVAEGLARGLPLLLLRDERVLGIALGIVGLAAGAGDERGIELVDLAGGMLELAGQVGTVRLRQRPRSGPGVLGPPGLALLGSLSVTGHG